MKPMHTNGLEATLETLGQQLRERTEHFLGYPVSKDFDYSELLPFLQYPLNNLGDPFVDSTYAVDTRDAEKEVVQFFAELFRAPANNWWGYVTNGGSEGNLYGLYLARELYPDAMVYYSEATHYSVHKNLHLLQMSSIVIRSQENGEIDYEDLRDTIQLNRHKPVIILANIGTTMTEARDDVRRIKQILKDMAVKNHYIHADGALLVGLGCEDNQIDQLVEEENLELGDDLAKLVMQEAGGTRTSVARGIEIVEAMLDNAARKQRQTVPASEIVVGLQCGGSDSFSGISANPALGAAVDRLVACGGTAILAETPEIYGAENLLLERAVSRDVGERLIGLLEWWDDYTSNEPQGFDNNPSPGNKAGGLTTILEKSLGAVAKGGTTNLVEVYGYGQPVDKRGLVFMDSPGFDPMSATGQVAGGANLIAFTTGRGSCFGCRPAPSIKLATNSAMFARMEEDMDINCGAIVDGEASIDEMGEAIFREMLATASGKPTKSELLGYGDDEFAPWHVNAWL